MHRSRIRAAYVHGGESAAEAVALCYRAAGGAAIFEAAPFERALRDVNAVLCHLTLQHRMMELAGQVAFGMPLAHPLF
jgi:alkylation response protein AidB-like acyl-CoA dehydrogenase